MRIGLTDSLRRAAAAALVAGLSCGAALAQRRIDVTIDGPLAAGETLVIGFLGGRNAWDDERRGVRRLARRLETSGPPGVRVATFENRKRGLALEVVREALDTDADGRLSPGEASRARVVLYGQSFGGAAAVKLARELGRLGVPVLLTVQVDSVGVGDEVIPPNVARAANLYQKDGLFIRGARRIRAADPSRTEIVGNFEYRYDGKRVDLPSFNWFERFVARAHTKMDADPEVWARVEGLILEVVRRQSEERF